MNVNAGIAQLVEQLTCHKRQLQSETIVENRVNSGKPQRIKPEAILSQARWRVI